MNVLFVGQTEIVGSYLADLLIREGHTACWVTEEPQKELWNKKLKGNIYRGAFEAERFSRVLSSHQVDTVVFLTGAAREGCARPEQQDRQNQLLLAVLAALRDYKVERFLYLSSIKAGYGAPDAAELLAGEFCCEAYHKRYDLPLLILRMGYAYGESLEPDSFVGSAMDRILAGKTVFCPYFPEEWTDVIHGRDAAMAIYELMSLGKTGTYDLVTGHPLSFQQLYDCLGKAAGLPPRVEWQKKARTAPAEIFCDSRIKTETGWMPYTLLQEKGVQILAQSVQEHRHSQSRSQKRRLSGAVHWVWQHFARRQALRHLAETLLLFGCTLFLLRFGKDISDLKYVDIRLAFVAIVACCFGSEMSAVAVVLASLSYLYSLAVSYVDISYLLYSVDTWIPFVVYMITGAVIGYVVSRRQDKMSELEQQYRMLGEQHQFLKEIQAETVEIKNQLQQQIANSRHSFGDIYRVVEELDQLKPELILIKLIHIFVTLLDCENVAVFRLGDKANSYARLAACSDSLRGRVHNSLHMEQLPELGKAFASSRLFVNLKLQEGYPDYAAAVNYQGRPYCFIALYGLAPDKFVMYYQDIFRVLTGLVEKNLVRALEYEEEQHEKLYLPGTELLSPAAFADRLRVLQTRQGEAGYQFTLVRLKPLREMSRQQVSERIFGLIRASDYMGLGQNGEYKVILTNTLPQQIREIQRRFIKSGFAMEVEPA